MKSISASLNQITWKHYVLNTGIFLSEPYLSYGQYLFSNMIHPECQVTWPHSPVSLEFLLLERLMKYREARGVAGYFGYVLSCPVYQQCYSTCLLCV